MNTYRATARREGRYWVVAVDGVGVTQGRNLADAAAMAEDLVVAMVGTDPADIAVALEVDLPGGLGAQLEAARRAVAEAAEAQQRAGEASRAAVRALRKEAALSGRDVATLLGVSEQRVSQLLTKRGAEAPHGLPNGESESVTVRLAWVEPLADSLTLVEGDVPRASVWRGEMVMDAEASPGPEGIYRLISEEEAWTIDPQNPAPVFLFQTHEASIVKWMKPLEGTKQETGTAEEVRRAVFDLVEARIAGDQVFSATAVVTSSELVSGVLHVVGRCVVVRPVAVPTEGTSSRSTRLSGHGKSEVMVARPTRTGRFVQTTPRAHALETGE